MTRQVTAIMIHFLVEPRFLPVAIKYLPLRSIVSTICKFSGRLLSLPVLPIFFLLKSRQSQQHSYEGYFCAFDIVVLSWDLYASPCPVRVPGRPHPRRPT